MAHSFSTASLLRLEATFDHHLARLVKNVDSQKGQAFDLKEYVSCYAYDLIGELAFDADFKTQENPSTEKLPPIPDHIWVGCMYGLFPTLLPYSMILGNRLPIPGLHQLVASRKQLRSQTSEYVRAAMSKHKDGERESLLALLMEATDPETGAALTFDEISSEAFAFL
jgi:cytochrome P450